MPWNEQTKLSPRFSERRWTDGRCDTGTMSDDPVNPGPWSCLHFSRSNPVGEGQSDWSKLLRTIAESIEDLGDVVILDLVFHDEINEHGSWPAATCYYNLATG